MWGAGACRDEDPKRDDPDSSAGATLARAGTGLVSGFGFGSGFRFGVGVC